jgi:hypothetical protein
VFEKEGKRFVILSKITLDFAKGGCIIRRLAVRQLFNNLIKQSVWTFIVDVISKKSQ